MGSKHDGVLEQMLELQHGLQGLDPSCCGGDDAVLAMRANEQLRRETVDHALIMTVVGAKQARVITSMLTKLPAAVCEQIPEVEARLVGSPPPWTGRPAGAGRRAGTGVPGPRWRAQKPIRV